MKDARAARVSIAAPAKINLYLHVVGRRPDGYHELDSLVAFADIADTVSAAPAADLSLAIDGRFAAALAGDPADNLVLRAASLLAARFGVSAGAALRLTKELPVASGIGGGSSDAAATLRALQELWAVRARPEELAVLASRLGADVPVCLLGRAAWLGGIGEALEPAPKLPPVAIVLVNPGIALSTPAVFKARRGPFSTPGRFTAMPADAAGLAAALRARRNDLSQAAIALVPAIGDVLARLAKCDGALLARMSGSGATCFALFAEEAAARAAAARLAGAHPAWWVAPGRLAAA
ncbi:MAG TPA: 4-(cytidine 5'-diphospho)-2-C-methyl-D-erythritol kinase [Stellaceae bacterium]|jgi:4-diphosphocytidyl-2-C-methyl-D-erythritol kinase|nr:4-(cytidine 5'-diphospho)-2-C-methyl-D-erythritol kinase [Stellaceae bacterium]